MPGAWRPVHSIRLEIALVGTRQGSTGRRWPASSTGWPLFAHRGWQGTAWPAKRAAMAVITPEVVAEHGLSPEEYQRVLHAMGREPNLTELGIFSVMWSEHCSYKSSRIHLKKLPTEAAWVICGPG